MLLLNGSAVKLQAVTNMLPLYSLYMHNLTEAAIVHFLCTVLCSKPVTSILDYDGEL